MSVGVILHSGTPRCTDIVKSTDTTADTADQEKCDQSVFSVVSSCLADKETVRVTAAATEGFYTIRILQEAKLHSL